MTVNSNLNGREVYVVDGARTPFLKVKNYGAFSASDLAVAVGRPLLNRQPFLPEALSEVIIGCAMPGPDEANIARIISLRLGCEDKVPAFTVMRNCASGMQAIDDAALQIASGRSEIVLAGGTEAMSHAPLLYNKQAVLWFSSWFLARTFYQRAGLLTKIKPAFFNPLVALERGLRDPLINMNMGHTAEELAFHFKISRSQMDSFAYESHHRLARAFAQNEMSEVIPMIDNKGRVYTQDTGMRADSTVEKLATLKPFFDKKYGMVTAANSSQITDGACLLILASKDAVKKYNLPVMGKIIDTQWAALNPSRMGLGPVYAATPIMQRHHLEPKDFDCWEINEAFAAQVLACLAAWDDKQFCKTELGLKKALGAPDLSQLNKDGGAIAAGHPIGASGARIVLHVLKSLSQTQGKRGMAAICIGGGQGGAMYLERVSGVDE